MLKNPFHLLQNQLLTKISQQFNLHYPEFSSNLGKYKSAKFFITLTDVPFNLMIECQAGITIRLANNSDKTIADSCVIGKARTFIQMLLRKSDGDSLFFQQKLIINGDTEAATAFRNCLEKLHFNLLEIITPLNIPLREQFIGLIKSLTHTTMSSTTANTLELVCPAGNLEILHTAIDAGADTVYFGFARHGNARNFAGLNFSEEDAINGVAYAHKNKRKILSAINAFPQTQNIQYVKETIDVAAAIGVDAMILADMGMLDYATQKHPEVSRHLSVQASAASLESLEFYAREFGIKRAVLPRVIDFEQIKDICAGADALGVEIEIFGFGGLCVMAEGRCSLSGYITGKAPNLHGVCSPAEHIHYINRENAMQIQLNQFTINEFAKDQAACYPTICKGKFNCNNQHKHVFEEPTSLSLLPELDKVLTKGVRALKIEGRQRGNAYVKQVITTFRYALDNLNQLNPYRLQQLNSQLENYMEGKKSTIGAYNEQWN